MSRVERTENPRERRASERRDRPPQRESAPGRTPGKAEGDEQDIEEAIERQSE